MPNQKKAAHASRNLFSMFVDGAHFQAAVMFWLRWYSAKVLPS